MPDIFLSYSREDQVTARCFAEALQREGFVVWWDQTLEPGEAYDEVTEKALEDARAVVVLWSRTSVASRWVRAEATTADRTGTLLPVMIEQCKRPIMFELRQSADLCGWNGNCADPRWQGFVAGLKRFVEKGQGPSPSPTAPPEPLLSTPAAPVAAPTPGRASARLIGLAAIAVLAITLGMLVWIIPNRQPTPAASAAVAASTSSTSPPAGPAAPAASIAVVPFENLTGDPSKDYLGDGLAEELINTLTKVPGLHVPARMSSFAYRGRNADARQIGKDLDVRAILEGSVRSAGERIRVTAQLVNTQTGYHFWSHSYDRRSTDLFELQDELASTIVQAINETMQAQLRPDAARSSVAGVDLEAYQLYLQSRALTMRGNPRDLTLSRELLERAAAKDPSFGRPIAAAAYETATALIFGAPMSLLEESERLARSALIRDPALAEAEIALGITAAYRGSWIEARDHLQKARSIDAADPTRPFIACTALTGATGHLQQAVEQCQEAYRLGPALANPASTLAVAELLVGNDTAALRYQDIAASLGASLLLPPHAVIREVVDLRAGRPEEARARAAQRLLAPELSSASVAGQEFGQLRDSVRAELALRETVLTAWANRSTKPAALAAIDKALQTALTSETPASTGVLSDLVRWYVGLGELDRAFVAADRYLRRYETRGLVGPLWVWLWSPEYAPMRRDPRFQELVRRLKLFDYWKQFGPPDGCKVVGTRLLCT